MGAEAALFMVRSPEGHATTARSGCRRCVWSAIIGSRRIGSGVETTAPEMKPSTKRWDEAPLSHWRDGRRVHLGLFLWQEMGMQLAQTRGMGGRASGAGGVVAVAAARVVQRFECEACEAKCWLA